MAGTGPAPAAAPASLSFDEMMAKDRADSTKRGYQFLSKHFLRFMKHRKPDLVSDNFAINLSAVTSEDLKAFFDHISIKWKNVKKDGVFSDPVDLVNNKHVLNSSSYVSSYRSALKWFFELHEVEVPPGVMKDLGRFTSGFKRVKNQRKQDGEEDAEEGKEPMQFSGYEWLAKKAVRATTEFSQAVFAWVFLLFAWNLISRGRNMGRLMFEHLSWQDDALTVRMFVKKHDQEGKDCKPKHVFANPVKPWICPILALAVYIFTAGVRRPGAKMLVFGNDGAEERFSKWLRGILVYFEEPLRAMGITISNIGTHSFRKGTATWLAGMVDGPSGVQIYLRAGWSLGMQKLYIYEGGGSDRHVGRAATGLTLDSVSVPLPGPRSMHCRLPFHGFAQLNGDLGRRSLDACRPTLT